MQNTQALNWQEVWNLYFSFLRVIVFFFSLIQYIDSTYRGVFQEMELTWGLVPLEDSPHLFFLSIQGNSILPNDAALTGWITAAQRYPWNLKMLPYSEKVSLMVW